MSMIFQYKTDSAIVVIPSGNQLISGFCDTMILPEICAYSNLDSIKLSLVKLHKLDRMRNESPILFASNLSPSLIPQIVQFAFEVLNAPGLYIAHPAVLALYGCGVVTGLVVDIGSTITVTAVYDSIVVAQKQSQHGNKQVTEDLIRLLKEDLVFLNAFEGTVDEALVEVCLFNNRESRLQIY